MKRIVISGATGLIGTYLVEKLKHTHQLTILTRHAGKYKDKETENLRYTEWDGVSAVPHILESAYGIINLAGENIGKKRWTTQQKSRITESRVNAAKAIKTSMEECRNKPEVWIQASATGYYGQQGSTIFNEDSPKGKKEFLPEVCEKWEEPIQELSTGITRKIIIRTGVVLAPQSDLWKQLNMSFNFGIAAIPGNGRQHLPWIHIEDEANAIIYLLENHTCEGIFNLCAPHPATMKQIIDNIKYRKLDLISIHIPSFFLKLLFGSQKTKELVLTNQNVYPKHLLEKGYKFTFEKIEKAVDDLI